MNKETQHGPPHSWTSAASSRRAGTQAIPGEVMKRAHREKLNLCDSLESIADALPNVDRLKCLGTAKKIVPLFHGFEETEIFPAYEAHLTPAEAKLASTSRLRVEHLEDQCFASEVAETLLAIGHGDAIESPEAVGFMLRGFFEGLRRHIAFEREHVLPRIAISDVDPGA
nr:hemerythrin domain-containing protein [Mesorhizobium sp. AA23]